MYLYCRSEGKVASHTCSNFIDFETHPIASITVLYLCKHKSTALLIMVKPCSDFSPCPYGWGVPDITVFDLVVNNLCALFLLNRILIACLCLPNRCSCQKHTLHTLSMLIINQLFVQAFLLDFLNDGVMST